MLANKFGWRKIAQVVSLKKNTQVAVQPVLLAWAITDLKRQAEFTG